MNAFVTHIDIPAFDPISYDAAVRSASNRAAHSFFDSHVIEVENGEFIVIDEGDYNALPMQLIDRIVYTAPGMMADDLDAGEFSTAASFISIAIDPEWDDDWPF
jgi:hypothetical protein